MLISTHARMHKKTKKNCRPTHPSPPPRRRSSLCIVMTQPHGGDGVKVPTAQETTGPGQGGYTHGHGSHERGEKGRRSPRAVVSGRGNDEGWAKRWWRGSHWSGTGDRGRGGKGSRGGKRALRKKGMRASIFF
jgi:hypothetical protein